MTDVCLSGGCRGADVLFGDEATKAGHKVVHWGFSGMHSKRDLRYLRSDQLQKADPYLVEANKILERTFPSRFIYTNNLLRRNYYQIKNSQRVYAVSSLFEDGKVKGGTGWAVAMAILKGISEIYFYDQELKVWHIHLKIEDKPWSWVTGKKIPKPHGIYTGIGSSVLNEAGENAIRKLYDVSVQS